ncbi:unnamed protein product, partial [Owenia fusiformis]
YFMMEESRKRLRSFEEDCDDFMPISKRIHRLNIRQEECPDSEHNPNGAQQQDKLGNNPLPWQPGGDLNHNYSNIPSAEPSNNNNEQQLCLESPHMNMNGAYNMQQCIPGGIQNSQIGHSSHNRLLVQIPQGSGHTHPGTSHADPGRAHIDPGGVENSEEMEVYNPDLTEHDNPHYYHLNRILFAAHKAKVQRNQSH